MGREERRGEQRRPPARADGGNAQQAVGEQHGGGEERDVERVEGSRPIAVEPLLKHHREARHRPVVGKVEPVPLTEHATEVGDPVHGLVHHQHVVVVDELVSERRRVEDRHEQEQRDRPRPPEPPRAARRRLASFDHDPMRSLRSAPVKGGSRRPGSG
jgi:hypothetical protein